jgi:hypothetical protein
VVTKCICLRERDSLPYMCSASTLCAVGMSWNGGPILYLSVRMRQQLWHLEAKTCGKRNPRRPRADSAASPSL